MSETKVKLVITLVTGCLWVLPAMGLATFPSSTPLEGMVLISGGIYPMGSHQSLTELNPGDLFNTDRHTLGPENPAHNVVIDTYYIDIYEVTHGAYMELVKATSKKKPRFSRYLRAP